MKKLKAALPTTGAHIFFLGGLASIVVGASLIYRPAGYIVGGLLSVWIAVMISAESK